MYKKSIFILLFMAAISYVSAQSIRLEHDGTIYADGETVVCDTEQFGEFIQHFQVRNLTDHTLNVMLRKEVIDDLEGVINYFCWGSCYTPEVTVSLHPVEVAGMTLSSEDLSFHAMYEESVFGKVFVKYSLYDIDTPDDCTTIYVCFNKSGEGIIETPAVNFGQAYPNPASSVVNFDYTMPASSHLTAVIYNIVGQEVMRQELNTFEGRLTLSVNEFQDGIYFCNLTQNGQTITTLKFVVKK